MKTYIVVYACLIHCETFIEKITANNWKEAVEKHTKYPWRNDPENDVSFISVNSMLEFDEKDHEQEFKHLCYNIDGLMDWIEL